MNIWMVIQSNDCGVNAIIPCATRNIADREARKLMDQSRTSEWMCNHETNSRTIWEGDLGETIEIYHQEIICE